MIGPGISAVGPMFPPHRNRHLIALNVGPVTRSENFTMNWIPDLFFFFGGAFLPKSVPHFVSGVMGRPFQSPFAKPPGKGLSSSSVNVIWGSFNALLAYLLLTHVGAFHPRATTHILAFALGALLISLFTARHF